MYLKFVASVPLFILVLSGCADLGAVRSYADESAKLSSYTDLTKRFRDTYDRENPYLYGTAIVAAKKNDDKRKVVYNDLIKIHKTIFTYMVTLGKLAGSNTFDLSSNIDDLSVKIKEYSDLNIDKKQVDAVANISKVISKWILSSHQEKSVRDMIKDGNADVQTVLNGMLFVLDIYKKTNESEKQSVINTLQREILISNNEGNLLLVVLGNVQLQNKIKEYAEVSSNYDNAYSGIKTIAAGHQKLYDNINDISNSDMNKLIEGIANDIKLVRDSFEIIHN
ncbi:MAG: hypothetical protein BWK73_39805 [Thiothrix lacustris]|uniref:Lipoprotein n=1 Tax=Thiothrix lacustris TaxID=525917 RepID=A0A1Y1QE38_9GAMM|nr:MAG: hypothetical protein BWK73_39805 [Thiothrix lacustris]